MGRSRAPTVANMYREHAPPRIVEEFVDCLWSLVGDGHVPEHLVAPDGCANVVFCRGATMEAAGAMTVSRKYERAPVSQIVGIRLRPGSAGAFFRIGASEITDCVLPADSLIVRFAREVEGRLEDAGSAGEGLRILSSALAQSCSINETGKARLFRKAVRAMIAANGQIDLDVTARHANLTVRQFRRRCLEETGLSPKMLCRVLRFRRALGLMRRPHQHGVASLALDSGYYDQSHFIREFREFTGFSPGHRGTLIWPFLDGSGESAGQKVPSF